MKTYKALFFLLLALPLTTGAAFAQTTMDELQRGDGPTGTVKKTTGGKDPLHGLILNLGLASTHRLNLEPDNAEWVSSYHLGLGWRLGKILAPKTWFKALTLSASFNFSNDLVGNNPIYRSTQFSDPDLYTKNLSYLGLNDSLLQRSEEDNIDRRVDGADRRIDYSDISITLAHGNIATIPGAKINVSGSIGAVIPLSLASINAGLKTKFDYGVGLSRSFKIGKMGLSLSYGLTFTHYIYDYATKSIDSLDDPIYVNGVAYDTYSYNSTSRNNEYAFTNMFSVGFAPTKKISIAATYGVLTMRTYEWSNCLYTTPTGEVIDVCATTT